VTSISVALKIIYASIALLHRKRNMSKQCPITGTGGMVGGGYSNRTRATQFNPTGLRRRQPNIQKRKIFIPELNRSMTLKLSTRAIKTINKNGAYSVLKGAGLI
jgi:large subunit ribosomal protein L28